MKDELSSIPKNGRPRIINLNRDAQRFLDLYLDPLLSSEEICRLSGIQKSTFYNYEKELNLPRLKVGFGVSTGHLPRKLALAKVTDEDELHELNLIRILGKRLQTKIKIVTVPSTDCHAVDRLIKTKEVDCVISSLTKTSERAREFYFSDEYFFAGSPSGVLIGNPALGLQLSVARSKPVLGVLRSSVHAEYAMNSLRQEFLVRHYRTSGEIFRALQKGVIDYTLFHPFWLSAHGPESSGLEVCSKPFHYPTHSAIVFHSDSQMWINPINSVIESIRTEHHDARHNR